MAINIFLNLASEGYPEAAYMLGRCYDKCGDPVEATEWMLIAANKGLKEAQFDVAIGYEMGKGVPQDYEEAAKWYRKAAAQGVKEAQDNLNELINEGKIKGASPSSKSSYSPPPSSATSKPASVSSATGSQEERFKQAYKFLCSLRYVEAIPILQNLVNEGHFESHWRLGLLYENGQGTPQNYAKAVEMFRKGAEKGNDGSMYYLARCYEEGKGVPQNFTQAVEWYRKSANLGCVGASIKIADFKKAGKIK
jgi:TPR repeat protein